MLRRERPATRFPHGCAGTSKLSSPWNQTGPPPLQWSLSPPPRSRLLRPRVLRPRLLQLRLPLTRMPRLPWPLLPRRLLPRPRLYPVHRGQQAALSPSRRVERTAGTWWARRLGAPRGAVPSTRCVECRHRGSNKNVTYILRHINTYVVLSCSFSYISYRARARRPSSTRATRLTHWTVKRRGGVGERPRRVTPFCFTRGASLGFGGDWQRI